MTRCKQQEGSRSYLMFKVTLIYMLVYIIYHIPKVMQTSWPRVVAMEISLFWEVPMFRITH